MSPTFQVIVVVPSFTFSTYVTPAFVKAAFDSSVNLNSFGITSVTTPSVAITLWAISVRFSNSSFKSSALSAVTFL